MKIKIGVLGSASGPTLEMQESRNTAYKLGKEIADMDCILVNGACPGLPNDAAVGCRENGGFVLGVSPAFSQLEHEKNYKSPDMAYDIIIFTGMGFMQRDILNIRTADALIVVGGGIGTLNEFTAAFEEGKFVGVLSGTGGISDKIEEIVKFCNRHEEFHDLVVIDKDPKKLVEKVILKIKEGKVPRYTDERVLGAG